MRSDLFDLDPGQTPLELDERDHLIPGHITIRAELNQYESENILAAQNKYLGGRRKWNLHDPEFLKAIHRDMFGETWKWAGHYRKSDKNLGVEWWKIPEEMKKVCDDFKYWKEHQSFSGVEIAVRLHHRLVSIHPFPNGNGRHARLVADIYIREIDESVLTWGSKILIKPGRARDAYLSALKAADVGNFSALLKFAIS